MAKEDIAIKKFESLMKFQKLQGCEAIANLYCADNATYTSRSSGEEFQKTVADEIHEKIVSEIKRSDMYSVLVDESTDVAVCKHMVIYIRLLDAQFIPRTYFLTNSTIKDPKSDAVVLFGTLKAALQKEGLNLKNILGFGSDGASVMVGKTKGLAAKMKEESPHCVSIHCMAHRLNLATSQASENVPYMQEFEKLLSDLYYYFGGSKSGNRKCALEEIQKVLKDPMLKIKECHQIRWLAFFEAVRAVHSCWASLHTYFCGQNPNDSKAARFRDKFSEYKFVAVLAMLMDILPYVSQMSMALQKRDLDISSVSSALKSLEERLETVAKGKTHYQSEFKDKLEKTRDSDGHTVTVKYKGKSLDFGSSMSKTTKDIEKIRKDFCDNMRENIKARFPQDTKDVASAFKVLAMRELSFLSAEEKALYGVKEMEILTNFYGIKKTVTVKEKTKEKKEVITRTATSEAKLKKDECLAEWAMAKQTVLDNAYPRYSIQSLYKILHDYHKEAFPNLLILANLALIMPYQTADCERGFSCQNQIKTAKRNRLEEESLNVLMTIKCEGGSLEDYDFTDAVSAWKGKCDRRICKS
jgi:hypothetical protein